MKKGLVGGLLLLALILVAGAVGAAAWLLHATPSLASGKLFGFADGPAAKLNNGAIPVNTVTLLWSSAGSIAAYNAQGIRPIITADELFAITDGTLKTTCTPYTARVRNDWQSRANNWLATYGKMLTSAHIAGIAISTEQNNACISPQDIDTVAKFLISKGISASLLGVGQGIGGPNGFSASFPTELGWVALFDYNVLTPTDAGYQTILKQLRSKLTPSQMYLMVPRAYLSGSEAKAGLYPKWQLGWSVLQYANYCATDKQCMGVLPFLWTSVAYSAVDANSLMGSDQMSQAWTYEAQASHALF